MGSRQQAVSALKKHCQEAVLEDESSAGHYDVQLEAPRGYHWEGDVHSRPVHWFDSGNKSDFWDFVIEEIADLPPPRKCDDQDCEGVRAFGECEYWI